MLNLNPATLISRIIVLLTAFSVHEFAHAIMIAGYGYQVFEMKFTILYGEVTSSPYKKFRQQKHISMAGPISNFVLGFIARIPLIQFVLAQDTLIQLIRNS